eukprot:jgi/Chrzof1/6821/UNPLg00889.t1
MRAYLVARGYSAAITNAQDANSDKALASITLAVEDQTTSDYIPMGPGSTNTRRQGDAVLRLGAHEC